MQVIAHWKSKKSHTAAEHIGYNLIRGYSPDRGFVRLSDRKVSSRGNDLWYGYNYALSCLKDDLYKATQRYLEDLQRVEKRNTLREARFKDSFGIDLTDELRAKFPQLEKKHG